MIGLQTTPNLEIVLIASNVLEPKINYIIPKNDDIEIIFKKIIGLNEIKITKRELIDKNQFSCIEKITCSDSSVFVIKSISNLMKSEIKVHQYVNSLRINAPYFFYGKSSVTTGRNTNENGEKGASYIIMEYLDNYLHLYNILEDELYFEAVRLLGEMHLDSMQKIDYLKNQIKIPTYDVKWYLDNVDKIIFEISRLSIHNQNPEYLPKDLISTLQRSTSKIKQYLSEIIDIPNTLVHGDFDSGNIIFFQRGKNSGNVKVLDWGHGHIGPPVIDIAHLFNSLGYFDYERKIMLLAEYLKTCRPLYSKNVEFSLLIIGGTIIHYLYHLNFKLRAINEKYVQPEFFIEQIHKRVTMLTKILD